MVIVWFVNMFIYIYTHTLKQKKDRCLFVLELFYFREVMMVDENCFDIAILKVEVVNKRNVLSWGTSRGGTKQCVVYASTNQIPRTAVNHTYDQSNWFRVTLVPPAFQTKGNVLCFYRWVTSWVKMYRRPRSPSFHKAWGTVASDKEGNVVLNIGEVEAEHRFLQPLS